MFNNITNKNRLPLLLGTLFLYLTMINAFANTFGNISIDGNLDDWTMFDRINLPNNLPPYLATGHEIYGKFVNTPEATYLIAIKSTGPAIATNTTVWFNTDQNRSTGLESVGGAEYYLNVFVDSQPHLYNNSFAWIGGPLIHAYSADNKIIEIAIPASALSLMPNQAIDILVDINDSIFLPANYAIENYTIPGTVEVLPPRTDFNKRVGIVFGKASKNQFFGKKAYSQLFMAMQHQAMMAGISFEILTENDLTDVANIVNYDAIIFPYFAEIPNNIFVAVHDTLFKAIYHYNIGIITAGNFLTNDENGSPLPGDSYRYMKQLLGIGRVGGEGPVDISVKAVDVSHPVMKGYTTNELIFDNSQNWYSYFAPVSGQTVTVLANETVTGNNSGTYNAILASITGGRNVHFATVGLMGDGNLVWQALQWVIYDNKVPVGLKMGRYNSLFISRNDTDEAMQQDEVQIVHVPLYNLLVNWKRDYNFVGSFFIDIGNDPVNGEWTDWAISAPLFQDYIALGNEIGTHSWTHPNITNNLSPSEIEFEFNQSMNKISSKLNNKTWRDQAIRGSAVPGAPENVNTATEIIQYLDYLSGGFSSVGAGYPGAFGYLNPSSNKVYFSPDMTFDFTLIQYGVPVGNPPVPVPLTAAEAEIYWQNEYAYLTRHSSQPIIHWPWHDYAVTIAADPITGDGYTVDMFENTIAMAFNDDAEFVTSADVAQRIETFKDADLSISHNNNTITATVNAIDVGKFALQIAPHNGEIIENVSNWYAYNTDKVFLDNDGGTFVIQLGTTQDVVTRIIRLPMRAKLISLIGDGSNLNYSFKGEGTVRIVLNGTENQFNITGADSVSSLPDNIVEMKFDSFGTHTGNIIFK
jgi:hypothetical protein